MAAPMPTTLPRLMNFALFFGTGPYRFDHVDLVGHAVYTNKLRAGAFRGFGNPQVTFASECQIDDLAADSGIDPVDLRLKNLVARRRSLDMGPGRRDQRTRGMHRESRDRFALGGDSGAAKPVEAPDGKRRGTRHRAHRFIYRDFCRPAPSCG